MTTRHTSLPLRVMFGGKTGRAFGFMKTSVVNRCAWEGRFISGKI